MEVAITRMSSRGQVVIPAEMREDIQEGDKLLILKSDHHIIMKKANALDKNFEEDIEFAKRTEEAWQEYDKGKFVKKSKEDFLKELRSC